jgi:uncharacterized OB-fold protein
VSVESLQRAVVLPEPDADTRWWWDALAAGRLELPSCRACGRKFFPAQPACPHCGSPDWDRIEAGGEGELYSWIVAHIAFDPRFAGEVPYTLLAVDLEEGVRLVGRYRGDAGELRPQMRLRALIYHVEGQALLGFEPAS